MSQLGDGAYIKDPTPGAPRVSDLPTSRTLIVSAVSPALSKATAAIEAESLAELVQKVQKTGPIRLQVNLDDIVLDDATGEITKGADVVATMDYGDDPLRIINDFDPAALVAKTQTGTGEDNPLDRRLLIRQRLASLLISQLLEGMSKDRTLEGRLSSVGGRAEALSAIEAEIDRVESEVRKASDTRLLQGPGAIL
jgi:hypothetical protein